MKEVLVIEGKLLILREELERYKKLAEYHPTELICVSKLEAISALEWVLDKNEEW